MTTREIKSFSDLAEGDSTMPSLKSCHLLIALSRRPVLLNACMKPM